VGLVWYSAAEGIRMEHRGILALSARDFAYAVIVEPWAEEFEIAPGQKCQVVAVHPSAPPSFDVELYRGVLIVSVLESGSTYEFWRDGLRKFHMPVPIPYFDSPHPPQG
jgi:hypothetical protein